jgi:uncharacterized delta-60 repeat protein
MLEADMRIARRSAVALVAGLFLVSISSQLSWAAGKSGALDRTFGAGGKVLTDFGAGEEIASDLAIQSDGKIVAAGNFGPNEDALGDFALARYNLDGTLDPTFNGTGKVLTDFSGSGSDDVASALAIQSNGKIVVAGYSNAGGTSIDFALARYNPDGTLDPTFNATGKVLTDFGGSSGSDVAIQSDGKIVVAGSSGASGTSEDFALARYNLDGTLDPTFNGTGKVLTDFTGSGGGDFASSVAIQPDGKIVAAGDSATFAGETWTYDFALARYNLDGTLDPTFNGTGKVLTDFTGSGGGDIASSVDVQSDGKIVAAGSAISFASGGSWDFALARYNPDGTLDPTFNGTGKVLTDFTGSGSFESAHALAIQSDGKIVVAGESEPSGQGYSDFALARYTPRGRLDRRFGASGKVLTNFLFRARAWALVIQSDGKIVAAGGFGFAMARYLP